MGVPEALTKFNVLSAFTPPGMMPLRMRLTSAPVSTNARKQMYSPLGWGTQMCTLQLFFCGVGSSFCRTLGEMGGLGIVDECVVRCSFDKAGSGLISTLVGVEDPMWGSVRSSCRCDGGVEIPGDFFSPNLTPWRF